MTGTTRLLAVAGLCTAALFAVLPAQAEEAKREEPKVAGSGPNPWADCGIGAALFTETKWAAVTSNVIWDLGITAVISATASQQTCSGKRLAAANFINQTYANLAEEAAAGRGEHLTTVLDLLECDSARQPQAIAQVRGAMARVVADPAYVDQTYVHKASTFYSIVDSAARTACAA